MQDVSQHFVIPLNSYNEMGNCVLNETERKVFCFECNKCRMITFIDFEKIANRACVILMKER